MNFLPVAGCQVGDTEIASLASALSLCRQLQSLQLSSELIISTVSHACLWVLILFPSSLRLVSKRFKPAGRGIAAVRRAPRAPLLAYDFHRPVLRLTDLGISHFASTSEGVSLLAALPRVAKLHTFVYRKGFFPVLFSTRALLVLLPSVRVPRSAWLR
jgi:hypothetical protein